MNVKLFVFKWLESRQVGAVKGAEEVRGAGFHRRRPEADRLSHSAGRGVRGPRRPHPGLPVPRFRELSRRLQRELMKEPTNE